MSLDESSEKLLNLITKDGKCSNLEKMLSNVENSKSLGQTRYRPDEICIDISG